MKKLILKVSRKIISLLPRGKTFLIDFTLNFAGREFNDFISINGGKVYIKEINGMNKGLFFTGKYEEEETELTKRLIKKGDYVFDLGANYGWYSILTSKLVGSSGKVFAFELDSQIAECLKATADASAERNIFVENVGVGSSNTEVEYYYDDGNANINLEWYDDKKRLPTNHKLIRKRGCIITLDSYIKEHGIPRVDFIKCDIDGAEVKFLKGAIRTINKFRPTILMEVAEENRVKISEILEGYTVSRAGNNSLFQTD